MQKWIFNTFMELQYFMVKNRCFAFMFVFSWSLWSEFSYIHGYILIISKSLQHVWSASYYQPVGWVCHTYSFFHKRSSEYNSYLLSNVFFNIAQEMFGLFVSYVWSKKSLSRLKLYHGWNGVLEIWKGSYLCILLKKEVYLIYFA
jgi:hypothetical protein